MQFDPLFAVVWCLAAPVESKADLRSTIVAEFVVSIQRSVQDEAEQL